MAFMILVGLPALAAIAQDQRDGRNPGRHTEADASFRATLDQGVVDGCLMCHRDALSLAGRDPETLAATIASMISGQADHLVPLPELNEADREALAEALAGSR